MTIGKLVLMLLVYLMSIPQESKDAKVTPLMSKDLTDFPGKEGLMIMVEYPPGSSDPIHRHDAHAFVYVLEGSIVMQVRGGKEVTLTPGQTFYEGPSPLGPTTHATAALHEAVAIQHRVDGALGRHSNTREPAKQTLTDFARTPAGVLTLDVQDVVLYLEWKLVGIAIRAPASVGEPLNAAFLVAIEDLVAGLTGNTKLPAKFRHGLAG